MSEISTMQQATNAAGFDPDRCVKLQRATFTERRNALWADTLDLLVNAFYCLVGLLMVSAIIWIALYSIRS